MLSTWAWEFDWNDGGIWAALTRQIYHTGVPTRLLQLKVSAWIKDIHDQSSFINCSILFYSATHAPGLEQFKKLLTESNLLRCYAVGILFFMFHCHPWSWIVYTVNGNLGFPREVGGISKEESLALNSHFCHPGDYPSCLTIDWLVHSLGEIWEWIDWIGWYGKSNGIWCTNKMK